MLEKTLESPLDCKEIKPILKEISPEYSLKGLMLKLKRQYFGYVMRSEVKSLSCARLFVTPWIVACTKLLRPWDFQGKSTGVCFLLQGFFPTQGLNPGLSHCRHTIYHLSNQGSSHCRKGVLKTEKFPNTRKHSHCRVCGEPWNHRGQHNWEEK